VQRGAPIDWAGVHERLARISSEARELASDQAQAVLAQRAQALAAPIVPAAEAAAGLSVVVLTIAGERYAIETVFVWRVMSAPSLARLPGSPEILLGVTNLYGEVLPVFDPRRLLGFGSAVAAATARVLVLGTERADFGLAVDAVQEVTTLRAEQLLAVPDSIEPVARALLRGVCADGLILLEGANLLTDSRLVIGRSESA
jgi:purine-binding chemotaxis protein CheW